jgi:hypothetical protein
LAWVFMGSSPHAPVREMERPCRRGFDVVPAQVTARPAK